MSSLVVRNVIGAGGYGHVYHASWKGRKAAVKKFFVVREEVRQSAAIQREIDILKSLVDRHVIQFYGTAYHEGMLVLIMDYAEGGSLKRAIDSRRVTDWPTKKRVAQEIVRGLAYIHHEGVIHRDLKSLNVLFTRHMEVKLCDFGLATIKVRSVVSSTTLKGTIRWMAPELFVRKPNYSTKSDMYALGIVMWEMAANCTMPFQNQPSNEIVARLVEAGEREELPEDTPDDYRQWVERCWAHDPLERPEASEMVVDDDVSDHGDDDEVEVDTSLDNMTSDVQILTTRHSSSDDPGVTGEITDKSPEDVKALLTRASKDDVEALLALASIYENGIGVDRDDSMAFKWYLRAAELHSTLAEAKTGDNFYHGRGTPKDLEAAVHWRRQAAEKGHSEAQLNLGLMYDNGRGVVQDYTEAASWYRKSAEQGNAIAQNNLGLMYQSGYGVVVRDYAKALSLYHKSADQGNSAAQNNLGLMYQSGYGVVRDYAKALSWYHKSADQGSSTAQNNIGVLYENGIGVASDKVEARSWYRKSAEQGYKPAQYKLGDMYRYGNGVAKDDSEALLWYRKAAERGYEPAQYKLGDMYMYGNGVAKDYAEALLWYRKSADQGNAHAQFEVGQMYKKGLGTRKDMQQAVQWYQKAANQGNFSAEQKLAKRGKWLVF